MVLEKIFLKFSYTCIYNIYIRKPNDPPPGATILTPGLTFEQSYRGPPVKYHVINHVKYLSSRLYGLGEDFLSFHYNYVYKENE